MSFFPNEVDRLRLDMGMAIDFFYISRHPITEELGIARIALSWDPASGEWTLPNYQDSLPTMAEGSDFFTSEDEAREALARDEWRWDDPIE
jgi:hypothetical protein